MTKNTLIVINPNASQTVTDGIKAAVDPLRGFGTAIRCLTLTSGPPAIENQRQADLTIAPMLRLAAEQKDAAGYVIACFGDPGLHALRDQTDLPVVGIQEASVMTALTLGQRFGVISILPASIPRHMRAFGAMGVLDRLAGDQASGRGVGQLADPERSLHAMVTTARKLRDDQGADVLIREGPVPTENRRCNWLAGRRTVPSSDRHGLGTNCTRPAAQRESTCLMKHQKVFSPSPSPHFYLTGTSTGTVSTVWSISTSIKVRPASPSLE